MKKKIVIALTKNWFTDFYGKKFIKKKNIIIIRNQNELNLKNLKKINPDIIYLPHWSFKIKEKILLNFKCIGFHIGNLPKDRGGSPIQNLILKNKKTSYLNAIELNQKFDDGNIYLRQKINLEGNLDQIFQRASKIIYNMIIKINSKKILPKKQIGKATYFKRIINNNFDNQKKYNLETVHNLIRMVDHYEYKNTYLKFSNLKISFSKSIRYKNKIYAKAKIEINKN